MSRQFKPNKNIPPSTTYPGRVTRNSRYPPTTVTAPSTGSGSTTTESNYQENNPFVSTSTMFRTPVTTAQQGIRPAPEGALPPRTTASPPHSSSSAQTSQGEPVSLSATLGASTSQVGQPDPIYTTAGGTSGQSSSGSRNSTQLLADAIYMTTMNGNANRQNDSRGEPQQQNGRNESAQEMEPPNDLLIDLGENMGSLSNQQSNRNSTAQTTRSLLDEPEPAQDTGNLSNQQASRTTATQASRSLVDEPEPPRYRTLPTGPRSRNDYGEPPPGYDEPYRTPSQNRFARNDNTPYGRNAYGSRPRQGYTGATGRRYNGNQYATGTYRDYTSPRNNREREPRYEEHMRDLEHSYYGGPSQRDLERGTVYRPESGRRQGSNTRQDHREPEPPQRTPPPNRPPQSQVTVEYALGQNQSTNETNGESSTRQEQREPEPPQQAPVTNRPVQTQTASANGQEQRQEVGGRNVNVTPNVSPIPLPPPEAQHGVLLAAPTPATEDTSEIPIPRDMIEKFRDCMAYISDRAGDGRTGQACRGASVALQDYLSTSRGNNGMIQQEHLEQTSRSVDEYTRNWNRDIQEAARERERHEEVRNQANQGRRNSTPCEEELTPATGTGVKMPSTRRGSQAPEPATQNAQCGSRKCMSVRIQERIEDDEPGYYVRTNLGGPMLRCTYEPRAGALTAPAMDGEGQQRRDSERERRDTTRANPPQRSNQRQEIEREGSQDAARNPGNSTRNLGARPREPPTPTTTYYSGMIAQEGQRPNGTGRSREENVDWNQRITDEDVGDVADQMNVPFESTQQRAEVAYLIRDLMQEQYANRRNRTEEGARATRETARGDDPEPIPPAAEAVAEENGRNRPPRAGANRKSMFKEAPTYRGDDSISLQKWRTQMEKNFLFDGVVDDIEKGGMALTKLGGDAEDTISNEMLDKGIKSRGTNGL